MNIFVLDKDPVKAAQYHCDKHVNKMIIEHLQMMSITAVMNGLDPAKRTNGEFYRTKMFRNHPCTLWMRESWGNWMWTYILTWELCREFEKRFGHPHGGKQSLISLEKTKLLLATKIPNSKVTEFAQAMPDQYKVKNDAVASYRTYYNMDKNEFAKWKLGNVPHWWSPGNYAK
jgi:hypothetical protein